jgi:hypothetical protein
MYLNHKLCFEANNCLATIRFRIMWQKTIESYIISRLILAQANMGLNFVSGQYGCLFSRCRKYVINSLIHEHFHIGLVIIQSARHFDNCKEKSREILDWVINKVIITWCFSYWPSYRSSVCCILTDLII